MSKIRLYTYWRSTAAYRVRIALCLKGIDYEPVPIHLARGEHRGDYRERNPQGLVPALEHDGHVLIQSLAIINYLERVFPQPALLPDEPLARARVSALAQIVTSDMHPLNNLRVLQYLGNDLGIGDEQRQQWYEHWVAEGFKAIETLLQDRETGKFCHGNSPTLADVCLIPQVYNARRFECDLEHYPRIRRVEANCLALEAFDETRPELQPDVE